MPSVDVPAASGEDTAAPLPVADAAPPAPTAAVEDVALRFYRAVFAGDVDTVHELAINYDEMSLLTKRPVDRDEYAAAMKRFLRASDGSEPPVEVVRVEVIKSGTLRQAESEKVMWPSARTYRARQPQAVVAAA